MARRVEWVCIRIKTKVLSRSRRVCRSYRCRLATRRSFCSAANGAAIRSRRFGSIQAMCSCSAARPGCGITACRGSSLAARRQDFRSRVGSIWRFGSFDAVTNLARRPTDMSGGPSPIIEFSGIQAARHLHQPAICAGHCWRPSRRRCCIRPWPPDRRHSGSNRRCWKRQTVNSRRCVSSMPRQRTPAMGPACRGCMRQTR